MYVETSLISNIFICCVYASLAYIALRPGNKFPSNLQIKTSQ